MDNSWIGFVVFIASFIAGRYIGERALKTLNKEDTEKLIKGFAVYRIVNMVGIVVLVIFYFAMINFYPNDSATTLPIFIGLFVIYLLGSAVYSYRKLKTLEFPDSYINQFLFSTLVQYVGIFVFFGININAK